MKFIVGTSGTAHGVFLIKDAVAASLTARHPEIGAGLTGLAGRADLTQMNVAKGVEGESVPVASIVLPQPSLPMAARQDCLPRPERHRSYRGRRRRSA